MISFKPEDIPVDILPPIFAHLTDRRHLHAVALVSRTFNGAATPLLYRTLDGIISKGRLHHPSRTLLKRPELAQYVRHVTETGAVHGTIHHSHPTVTADTLASLRLCINLESLTWNDDSSTADPIFLSFLPVVRQLRIREIIIYSYSDLGEEAWTLLRQMSGFTKVAIWCMEGPPRVLQGWSDKLGATLTHLELGRCAGVPPTILGSVLSQVPLLQELRLRGVPSAAIPSLLTYLPNLITLDVEFQGSGLYRSSDMPLPRLRNLTVRTSSMDSMGPQKLWFWIRQLSPYPSLESFTLNAFSVQGPIIVPQRFIMDLASTHKATLREFMVNTAQLTLEDIKYLCRTFPGLEHLTCSVASLHVNAIRQAIENGRNLRSLRLHVQWIPDVSPIPSWIETPSVEEWQHWTAKNKTTERLTVAEAKDIMLSNNSRIRVIGLGEALYTGYWVCRPAADGTTELEFEVLKDLAPRRWAAI